MLEIGITGNIGSGKSAVSSYLMDHGYKLIDADQIVKLIYKDQAFVDKMIEVFGQDIKAENFDIKGELDKKKIANIVFKDKEKLELLDKTVGPFFKKIMDRELEKYQEEDLLFLDIPLLYEKNYDRFMDKVILVYCQDEIRYTRASKRDHKTKEDIRAIDKSQMPQEDKLKKADYIIDNSRDFADLYRQIDKILAEIREIEKKNE